jgi:hypothetical protein
MRVHANAKLGPAGRLALVLLIEGGMLSARRGGREFCFGGHGASVVASLAGRVAAGAREWRLACGSLQLPAPPAQAGQ